MRQKWAWASHGVVLVAVMFSTAAFADVVILKSGYVAEGVITDKTDAYLAMVPSDRNGAKTYYLADRIDKVNGKSYRQFRLAKNALVTQKFRCQKGQKYPVVTLTLKSGRVVTGQLVNRDSRYFRILVQDQDRAEEFLLEDIARAE